MVCEADWVLDTPSRRSLQCDTNVVRHQLFLRIRSAWSPTA
jgi:hypothetical protein